ncbi:MAG TPA: EamA family transporter [Candidatus Limnocylindrales bacterium]
MPPGVVVLVLVVAVLHVAWNALLKTSGDTLRTAERAMIVGVAAFAPPVLIGWWVIGRPGLEAGTVALAIVSGLLEAAYFICLAEAYRRGDLSVVYPIARGTAPVLSVALGVSVLGERLAPIGIVGVAALLTGILLVQRPWRVVGAIRARIARSHASASSTDPTAASLVGAAEFAMLTGVMIAGYSAVDSVGARQAPVWLYAGVVFPVCAIALVAWVRLVARPSGHGASAQAAGTDRRGPAPWLRSGAAGTISLGAYGLILIAYTLAPLTAIAPLRESSVVIASAWGALRMGEGVDARDRARRLGGAGLVLVGAVLLAI